MFNSFPVLSGQEPCVFPFPVSPYALHKMDMNCPSVGWIYLFIHNSGSVAQCTARERTSGLEGLGLELWPPMWSRKTGAASGPQNARCERSFSQLSVETEGVDTEALRCRLGKGSRLMDTNTTAPPRTDIRKAERPSTMCWSIVWSEDRGVTYDSFALTDPFNKGSESWFSYLKGKAFSNAESYYHWPDGLISLERSPLLSTSKTTSLDLSSHSLWSLRSGLRGANTTSFHVTSVTLRILP